MNNIEKAQVKWRKKNPWRRHYDNAGSRCRNHKSYVGRGIKMKLTLHEIEFLWYRDNAKNMKQPSLDRKDGKGNYEFSNCRFIEMEENREPQPVIMFKIFKSAGEAGRQMKIDMRTICHCANRDRKNKTYKGFYWSWLKDNSSIHNLLTGGK